MLGTYTVTKEFEVPFFPADTEAKWLKIRKGERYRLLRTPNKDHEYYVLEQIPEGFVPNIVPIHIKEWAFNKFFKEEPHGIKEVTQW